VFALPLQKSTVFTTRLQKHACWRCCRRSLGTEVKLISNFPYSYELLNTSVCTLYPGPTRLWPPYLATRLLW
jgi:hypothetical protein